MVVNTDFKVFPCDNHGVFVDFGGNLDRSNVFLFENNYILSVLSCINSGKFQLSLPWHESVDTLIISTYINLVINFIRDRI
jgi:hypothetical protein